MSLILGHPIPTLPGPLQWCAFSCQLWTTSEWWPATGSLRSTVWSAVSYMWDSRPDAYSGACSQGVCCPWSARVLSKVSDACISGTLVMSTFPLHKDGGERNSSSWRPWLHEPIQRFLVLLVWANFVKARHLSMKAATDLEFRIWQNRGASLVVQWLRTRLPTQETQVRALVQKDPTRHGATKPMRHNHWACALEPASHNYWARVPQLLKHTRLEPVLPTKESTTMRSPSTATKSSPHAPQLEKKARTKTQCSQK